MATVNNPTGTTSTPDRRHLDGDARRAASARDASASEYGNSHGNSYGNSYGGYGGYGGYGSYGGYGGYGGGPGPYGPYGPGAPPPGGPPATGWQALMHSLSSVVHLFGKISFLVDENTQALHFFIMSLLQLLDRGGHLYGELSRVLLKAMGYPVPPRPSPPQFGAPPGGGFRGPGGFQGTGPSASGSAASFGDAWGSAAEH